MPEIPQGQLVKFAEECRPCELCGEPFCDKCDQHYADCACVGPTEDGFNYVEWCGVLYATPLEEENP